MFKKLVHSRTAYDGCLKEEVKFRSTFLSSKSFQSLLTSIASLHTFFPIFPIYVCWSDSDCGIIFYSLYGRFVINKLINLCSWKIKYWEMWYTGRSVTYGNTKWEHLLCFVQNSALFLPIQYASYEVYAIQLEIITQKKLRLIEDWRFSSWSSDANAIKK